MSNIAGALYRVRSEGPSVINGARCVWAMAVHHQGSVCHPK